MMLFAARRATCPGDLNVRAIVCREPFTDQEDVSERDAQAGADFARVQD